MRAEEMLTSRTFVVHGAEPAALLGLSRVMENPDPPVQRIHCAKALWVVFKA